MAYEQKKAMAHKMKGPTYEEAMKLRREKALAKYGGQEGLRNAQERFRSEVKASVERSRKRTEKGAKEYHEYLNSRGPMTERAKPHYQSHIGRAYNE